MKKLFITIFVLTVISVGAFAQVGKGAWLISASSNGSLTSYKAKDQDAVSYFSLSTRAGYFFVDNFTAGLLLELSKYSDDDDAYTALGPFFRYYFAKTFFAGLGVTFAGQGGYNWTEVPIEVGYAAFINKNIAIEPSFNLDFYSGDRDATSIGLNVGFAVYLGR